MLDLYHSNLMILSRAYGLSLWLCVGCSWSVFSLLGEGDFQGVGESSLLNWSQN